MFMSLRYKKIYALLLAAMLTVGGTSTIKAQTQPQTGPTISGSVYGGGNAADVGVNATVNITHGTVTGSVYGGGFGPTTTITGDVVVNIGAKNGNTLSGSATITGDVYGGSAKGKVNATKGGTTTEPTYTATDGKTTHVNIYGTSTTGIHDVYGGGHGLEGNSADVYGAVTVTTEGGKAQNVFGCNNLNGAPQQAVVVNIQGGTITNNVYGGGNQADAPGNITVNIQGGTVTNDVYGGGALANTNTANWQNNQLVYAYEEVTGLTVGTSSVDGYFTLENTTYTPATGKAASGKTYYRRKYSTTVNLTGGTIGNAYGGGLGDLGTNFDSADDDTPAYVYGDVKVNVNGTAFNIDTDEYQETVSGQNQTVKVAKSGRVFGCNNLSGSPKGEVTVHVLKTVNGNVERTAATSVADKDATHTYEIAAVYGGGNMAAYEPAKLTTETANTADADIASTNVIIEACGETSIQQVYGGGNAASTPSTKVTIKGSYEIDEVFGGGNGKDKLYNGTSWVDNPGAHVGFKKYTSDADKSSKQYGQGKARVNIEGGIIHSVFGGSNKKGNVRNVAIAMLDKVSDDCFKVDEAYGGGKAAPMDGRAILDLGCIPGVGEVYGGAQDADVNNDVELRIINGTYDKVYGGNNIGHSVKGTITVTIEEVGCEQIKIGELYGGGNNAAYSVEDIPKTRTDLNFETQTADNYYKNYPKVNVISATSIGKVFGGGDNAAVTGNPHVKIDMEQGVLNKGKSNAATQALGTIAQVFGGGNNAHVNGSTYVDIIKGQIKKVVTTQANPTNNVAEVAIMPGVYGGCNTNGTVSGDTHVTLTGAIIGAIGATAEICGGGLGQPTVVSGTAYLNLGTGTPGTTNSYSGTSAIVGDLYGGSAFGTVANAEVNIFAFESFAGDVYGGGKGKFIAANNTGNISAQVTGKSTVNMYATTITGHIYGGCNEHGTSNATEVNMLGGTLGVSGTPKADLLFAGGHGKETTTKNATMNIGSVDETTTPHTYSGTATIYSNVYGGSALGAVGVTSANVVNGSATVNLYQATSVTGDVFGDGMGDVTNNVQAKMGNSTVNLYDLELTTNIYGGCNYNGTVYGKATVNLIGGSVVDVYGGGQGQLTAVSNTGSVEVNVGTAVGTGTTTVTGDIYGGSAFGHVKSPVVNIYSATSIGTANAGGNVFGGGKGQLADNTTSPVTPAITASVTGTTTVNMKGGTVPKAIFGGCNLNGTSVDTEIYVTGGTVGSTTKANNVLYGVFGGGYGQNTSVTGDVIVNIGKTTTTGTGQNATTTISGDAIVYGDVYGGSAQGSVNKEEEATTKTTSTTVHLYAGTVNGDVYGGGLGVKTGTTNIPAQVYGDVLVDLNNYSGTCAVTGGIFGCNNANGSPEGHVTVHVYKTQKATGSNASYDLAAVYGGGNEADYEPNDGKKSTEVVIEGCNLTSIQNVYGGGNAAATPATEVWILGTKAIENVFGGGNGTVSAANVGFKTGGAAYSNGTGKAETKLVAGNVTNVFGGSNSNGDVRGGTWVTMPQKTEYSGYSATTTSCCDNLVAAHIYGGGQNAPLTGGTNIVLGCQPNSWIEEIYAGSMEADVDGDVSLTITSGKFERVFGGNKNGGLLKGAIKVNIEETGGCDTPIIIGELYGGGNQADYSVYGYYQDAQDGNKWKGRTKAQYDTWFASLTDAEKANPENKIKDDPQLNVRAFTSIGAIYGGGYSAKLYGNPHVDINVVKGSHYDDATIGNGTTNKLHLPYPGHTKDAIGAIGNVFGGGNLATVYGNATVNIGTESTVTFITEPAHLGTKGTGEQTLETTGVAYIQRADGLYEAKTEGANITNNVYGGGNQANVTGDTQVNICAKKSGTTYTSVTPGSAGVTIAGDVFGAGKGVNTDPTAALVESNSFIVMGNGSVKKSVYGGGELSQVAGNTDITVGGGTIGTPNDDTHVYGGATYGNIYGGGQGNTTTPDAGLIKGNTKITVQNTVVDANTTLTPTILHNIYGGGAYGSVGTITRAEAGASYVPGRTANILNMPTAWARKSGTTGTDTGNTEIYINGGQIGSNGNENGMVFGSSRGDVATPDGADADNPYGTDVDPNDRLAWVYDTKVVIGQSGSPDIRGSVYGSGENGHVFNNTDVQIHNGKIGVDADTPTYGTAEITDPVTNETYTGANYPKRGNVYGGGCGEDDYSITSGTTTTKYFNPLAGIVLGDTKVTIDGGKVVHNVYGAGALGSVGSASLTTGGKTVIEISGGQIGNDGNEDGNVYGAARGKVGLTQNNIAQVRETSVAISSTGNVKASVYGGGEAGNVRENTAVSMTGGTVGENIYGGGNLGYVGTFTVTTTETGSKEYNFIDIEGKANTTANSANKNTGVCTVTISGGKVGSDNNTDSEKGNVFGAGKGSSEDFECEPAMVYSTNIMISDGTVNGTVYGGGEVGRVENNTVVTIGTAGETGETNKPDIKANVFAAGKGLNTHGYSALVRGDSKVTVQGKANVEGSVFGGGEIATVGRYVVVDNLPTTNTSGGDCVVEIQDNANIAGDVYGAGKGVLPYEGYTSSQTPWSKTATGTTLYTSANETAYFNYITTLAIVSDTHVTVKGNATIGGSVYGGGQKGFVQTDTDVKIQGSCAIGTASTTTGGNVFGGGLGDASFAEAGRVKGNTNLTVSGGNVYGNVYGGGSLGDVGTIDKTDINNYIWSDYTDDATNNDTGICTVNITGGSIGAGNKSTANHASGHVFGAGKGLGTGSYYCEKAMVYKTNVSVTKGTVYGNVYGGGEVGRVENDAVVEIGATTGTDVPEIKGSVFGAGAGLETHGYSALVRNNTNVTIQGYAKVRNNVYGGGEIAAVGRYWVYTDPLPTGAPTVPPGTILGMPYQQRSGGVCTVVVKDHAEIGPNGGAATETAGHIYGGGKGVTPHYSSGTSKKMTPNGTLVDLNSEDEYKQFLETLALVTNTSVTIGGSAEGTDTKVKGSIYGGSENGFVQHNTSVLIQNGSTIGASNSYGNVYGGGKGYNGFAEAGRVSGTTTLNINGGTAYGSVYGGGELGFVKGAVNVNVTGGTVTKDVYGGGALADTNTENWNGTTLVSPYHEEIGLTTGTSVVTGLYTKNGDSYTEITAANTKAASGTTYYRLTETKVNLLGGTINGDAYGGGLGRLAATNVTAIEAKVYGDVAVTLDGSKFNISTYEGSKVVKSGRVFGCNNLNGSPKGNVTVTVERTVKGNTARTDDTKKKSETPEDHSYELAAVYGGGNLANYTPANGKVSVIINSCDVSIEDVYGGGNAAKVPATDVLVNGAYEIYHVFGGGNGADKYTLDNGAHWIDNPGADIDGDANTLLKGGLIHEAYGGSNERGTITGNITIDTGTGGLEACPLDLEKLVGAGKNADVNGNLIMVMGCKDAKKIPLVYGGADNANVNGNVELTITSGNFGQVFGGNNKGGAIKGHIILNIEETSECEPINIEELYLGGNEAAYSIYGYYLAKDENGQQIYRDEEKTKPLLLPRTSATDEHKPVELDDTEYAKIGDFTAYTEPVLNVVSCTSIGTVFGGGYGVGGVMYANPTVNINMIAGKHADGVPAVMTAKGLDTKENPNKLGIIGDVFGGGNEANVEGNTTVNIGTAAKVKLHNSVDANGVYTMSEDKYVLGAYITGNVFGGGKGRDDSFTCEKAMVNGSEGTCINIYNGTVRGSVYGGGEIGRVENNTKVTIGRENGENEENKSTPVIMGWVFGAGKGLNTHGYSALVRGNASVTIQAEAKIGQSVYGGGEIASVGKYNIAQTEADAKQYGVEIGMPYSLVSDNRGICNVIVRGNAEIGPDDMKMITTSGRPDDSGYVFGGGKGVLPYENTGTEGPKRMGPDGKWESYADEAKEADYLKFIETLALATQTEVTIGGKAFVKGSVYGGSENGHVQHNCHVTIKDECQIGNGFDTKTKKGVNRRYTEEEWASVSLPECAYWEYDATDDAPYDPYAKYSKTVDGKVQYYYDEACTQYAQGGAPVGKNGQTFFGNVFGGGSGYYPYAPGKWHREAGSVGGNTQVDITGGHILSNVYGGNELTDVKDIKDASGEKGICTINMTGGTIGVPRELAEVTAHPMSCSIYGGGKGDQRSIFDDLTNVSNTNVNISGGIIYGSVYGGAEDGHVTGGTNVTISGGTIGLKAFGGVSTGNVYAGGKGNLRNVKSGIIMGDTKVTVSNGTIYHNIYGGGAYGSVGTCEYNTDGTIKKYTSGGTATINITGGEIGWNGRENGMVFGSSRGDVGAPGEIHDRLAWVNNAIVTIGTSGSETGPKINGSVYGSGENGHTFNDALVEVHSGTIGIAEGVEVQYGGVTYSGSESPYRGNVYGGGCGTDTYNDGEVDKYNPLAGIVYGNTTINIDGGHVVRNVYGAGAMGSVGTITSSVKNESVDEGFGLSWPYKFEYAANTGKTTINITGGRIGCGGENDGNVFGAARGTANVGEYDVDKQRYEEALLANVRETEVNVNYPSTPSSIVNGAKCITGSVFGGGEDGHVNENAKITITGGLIGHSVYGGGKGKGTYRGKLKEIAGNHAEYETDICSWTAGKIYGNTEIVMTGGHVVRNIYGGGNLGSVGKGNYAGGSGDYYAHGYGEKISSALSGNTDFMQSGKAKITITGQSIVGVENINAPEAIEAGLPTGNVFGSSRGKTAADVGNLSPRYQYAPDFFLGYTNETEVIIGKEGDASDYPRIYGSVYGGGRDGHVRRSTTVTINNGKIGQDYTSENYVEDIATIDVQWRERGNVFGSGSGLGTYVTKALKKGSTTEYVDIARHGTSSGSVTEKTTVNIKGGTICQNVFGGGALSSVGPPRIPPTREDDPSTEQTLCLVNIEGGTIGTEYAHGKGYGGNVYGASRGGGLYFFKEKEYDVATENLPADESSDNYATTCFTKVKMMGGTVSGDVYGGGEAGIVKHDTEVSLTGGTIMHDAYGGGRGAANIAANVGGNTLVELNKGITAHKGCIVDRLFGANNVNGTPKGHVKVHVFATQNKSTKATNAKVKGQYDVSYVFGGGNASDYVPTANTESTEVIIEGCGLSSIYEVYGGGYGAAAPATNVLIKGTEIIDNVFGGGYGAGANNPGANIGYKTGGDTYGVLGENVKTAVVKLMAGKINNVYGGSNTKGDIRGGASVTNVANTGEAGCCENLTVDQIYGGGKNAEQQGGTEIVLGCMPNDWIAEIYAGAENADVGNDVSLTITSGKFGRVFGGNKSGGKLNGSIEVNIEENPECTTPIIIGELYGGGNLAPYSIYGYKEDGTARTEADYNKMTDAEKEAEGIRSGAHQSPRVNVRAFTSIGNIFGGGYGDKAEMVGSPTVNINEVEGGREYPGETKKLEDGTEVTLYQRTKDGKMGVIGNVFGGGNAAKVTGDTNVNIGTTSSERFVSVNDDPATIDVNEQYKTVLGADIRGNVYGGGNNAEVTGNTNVTIGKKATTTP